MGLLEKTKAKILSFTSRWAARVSYAMSDDECKSVAKTVVDEVKREKFSIRRRRPGRHARNH